MFLKIFNLYVLLEKLPFSKFSDVQNEINLADIFSDVLIANINNPELENKNPKFSHIDLLGNIIKEKNLSVFEKEILFYAKKYFNFVGINKTPIIDTSWATFHEPKCVSEIHRHPKSILSGVYYYRTKNTVGNLRIFENQFYNNYFDIIPEEGCIVFFPNELYHMITENTSSNTRVSLAFQIL